MGVIFKDEASKHKAKFIWGKCWRPFFTIFFPLLLSLIFIWEGNEVSSRSTGKPNPPKELQPRAAFVILLMACYWISECLPLPATALLPVFLIPILDIANTDLISSCYMNSSVLLLSAGCMIALSFEYSNLHTRIALKVTTLVGAKIPFLFGGCMFTGMFLSMWMNNTSTTAMMVPIVYVIMEEFEAAEVSSGSAPLAIDSKPQESDHGSLTPEEVKKQKSFKQIRNLRIMFLLGIAYASNIGGTGIITGTATNVLAENAVAEEKKKIGNTIKVRDVTKCLEAMEITFPGWFIFNVVPMLVNTFITWFILLVWFTGVPVWMKCRKKTPQEIEEADGRKQVAQNIEKAISLKYAKLGPMSLHEILVLIIFIVLIVLWMTGNMAKNLGWFYLFKEYKVEASDPSKSKPATYPHSAIPAVFCCILMFVLPRKAKYYKDFMKGGLKEGMNDPVLPWSEVERKVPWGPLILIGGGVAISTGITSSGLNVLIGDFLQHNDTLINMDPWMYLMVILLFVASLTTIASNTACAAILSPVLIEISKSNGVHPQYLLVTATVSASYAFMLPISTPPNAIVFDKSDMKQLEMMAPGAVITLATNIILFALVHSYDELIYNFNEYAKISNQYCNSLN